jgi:hypothetical protein
MYQIATLLKRWPGTTAAIGFGVAGTAYSALVWGPVVFPAKAALPIALFIGAPGISAAIAGRILGKPLLDKSRCSSTRAALRGAAVASVALLFFAPLFATIYVWTEPANEHWNVIGLSILLLAGSIFTVWGRVALIGAAVGWSLYRLARMAADERSADR